MTFSHENRSDGFSENCSSESGLGKPDSIFVAYQMEELL